MPDPEVFTQKWAVIAQLDQIDEGADFYYTDFPIHMTLAGVFAINHDGAWIADLLAKLLKTQDQVWIEADTRAMFGPHQDVAVTAITDTDELSRLYQTIYAGLTASGATFNTPQYEGSGYRPHSTIQKTGGIEPGDRHLIETISLVDLYPDGDGMMRKVFRNIQLRQQ